MIRVRVHTFEAETNRGGEYGRERCSRCGLRRWFEPKDTTSGEDELWAWRGEAGEMILVVPPGKRAEACIPGLAFCPPDLKGWLP